MGLSSSRIKIYGWASLGGDLSTSKHSNAPASYDLFPNSVFLDQAAVKIDRQPNTVQTDHFDYGFLLTNVFGTDYRYTTAKGYFSNQLLGRNIQIGLRSGRNLRVAIFP